MLHSASEPSPLPIRPRRLRRTAALREAAAETRVTESQLIQPHFVVPGEGVRQTLDGLPGIERVSVDQLVIDVQRDSECGIRSHLLFGVVDDKDPLGHSAADPEGPVARGLRALRESAPDDLVLLADVCLCGYAQHGHCGVVEGSEVRNDASLPLLDAAAVAYARAGADFVAPSDMMDGRVRSIRTALDREGLENTAILSYAAKFASAFYGPFRDAAHSAPSFGDRRSYQLDPRNGREALREMLIDVEEGADAVMVKPATVALDVLQASRERVPVPLAAYHVSGEAAMIRAAAERGWLDERGAVCETLISLARAGAQWIVTYYARAVAQGGWLR